MASVAVTPVSDIVVVAEVLVADGVVPAAPFIAVVIVDLVRSISSVAAIVIAVVSNVVVVSEIGVAIVGIVSVVARV